MTAQSYIMILGEVGGWSTVKLSGLGAQSQSAQGFRVCMMGILYVIAQSDDPAKSQHVAVLLRGVFL